MIEKREPPPWAILESERLLSTYISQDQKVPNVQFLIGAVANALNEAYQRGIRRERRLRWLRPAGGSNSREEMRQAEASCQRKGDGLPGSIPPGSSARNSAKRRSPKRCD
jgi:hypothetical protein